MMTKKTVLALAALTVLAACKKEAPEAAPAAQSAPPLAAAATASPAVRAAPPSAPSAAPAPVPAAAPRPAAQITAQPERDEEQAARSAPAAAPEPPPEPARVLYLSHTIKDGNSNGVIEPGETIMLTACVRNIGKGPGSELAVNIAADTLVPAIDEFSIWPVQPGETKCFPVKFRVPSKAGGEYQVEFAFSDGTKKEISLSVSAKPKTAGEAAVSAEKDRIKEKMKKAMDDLQ